MKTEKLRITALILAGIMILAAVGSAAILPAFAAGKQKVSCRQK